MLAHGRKGYQGWGGGKQTLYQLVFLGQKKGRKDEESAGKRCSQHRYIRRKENKTVEDSSADRGLKKTCYRKVILGAQGIKRKKLWKEESKVTTVDVLSLTNFQRKRDLEEPKNL